MSASMRVVVADVELLVLEVDVVKLTVVDVLVLREVDDVEKDVLVDLLVLLVEMDVL